jgi:hypothetical protein
MYDDLIKRLRETTDNHDEKCESCPYEEDYPCCVDCLDKMHKEAADAIEKLSKSRWEKFVLRPLTEEEQREHPDWCYILDCHTPDDGQEILVSDGRYVWTDTFYQDGDQCYLDGDAELESCWWQPMPQPPKEG